jgi:hypothetical protein
VKPSLRDVSHFLHGPFFRRIRRSPRFPRVGSLPRRGFKGPGALPTILFLSIAIAWLAALFGAGEVTGQTLGPNLNLTKAAGNQYEAAVAINPANNNQIFVVARNEIGGMYKARSSDGGATWTGQLFATHNSPPAGDIPRAYGNASVAWDNFGNLFLVYLAQGSTTAPTYVAISVSTDGGANFYSPTGTGAALLLPSVVPPYLIGDQPTVAVGPGSAGFAGSVWVTYWSQGGIWVSSAGVSGAGTVGSFTSQPLPSQPVSVNFGDIAVGPSGEAMVTYGPNTGSSGAIYTNTDPDGLGPAPFSSYVAAAPVNIGGFTGIPAQPNWGIDPEAGLAFDRSNGPHRGRVYLMYTDAPSVGSADTNIFVAHSDDRGSTWSAPVRVNDDTGTNSQFLPRISLDQATGMIGVTWYDARNSPLNNMAQYFGAFSVDGAASFTPSLRFSVGMSDQARSVAALKKTDYGDYTGNAFVNGRLVAVWADNSNSTGDNPDGATNFDVYTAVVQASPAVAGSVSDGSGSGTPLTVSIDAGGSLHLSWSASCAATDVNYAVYEGSLGNFTSHVPLLCSTSGATSVTITPGAGDTYYVVVPNNGSAEGSYGTGSDQFPRPPSTAACFPQATATCP